MEEVAVAVPLKSRSYGATAIAMSLLELMSSEINDSYLL